MSTKQKVMRVVVGFVGFLTPVVILCIVTSIRINQTAEKIEKVVDEVGEVVEDVKDRVKEVEEISNVLKDKIKGFNFNE